MNSSQENSVSEIAQANRRVVDLFQRGRYVEALPIAEEAFRRAEQLLGRQHPETATALHNFAEQLRATGQFEVARQRYLEAVELRRSSLGNRHAEVATSLNSLATLHFERGQLDRAETLCREATDIFREALGENHPQYAIAIGNLGSVLKAKGQIAEAEPLYLQAESIIRSELGDQHPARAAFLNNLVEIRELNGDYPQAMTLCRQALALREAVLDADSPAVGNSLRTLGLLQRRTGLYTEAVATLRRVLEIRRTYLPTNHPDFAASLDDLAAAMQSAGELTAAEPMHRQALEIRRAALGNNHHDCGASLSNLAELCRKRGNYDQSVEFFHSALDTFRKSVGESHVDFIMTLNSLGEVHRLAGDFEDAETLFQQSRVAWEKLDGEHSLAGNTLLSLAVLKHETGDYSAARILYRQAQRIHEQTLGKKHPTLAATLSSFGDLLRECGDFVESERLHWQAFEIRRHVFGSTHRDVAHSLNGLAELKREIGDNESAIQLYRQSVEVFEQSIGPEHPETSSARVNFANLLLRQRKFDQARDLYEQAVRHVSAAHNPEHFLVGIAVNNLAELHHATGELQQADERYDEAAACLRKQMGPRHPLLAQCLQNQAWLKITRGLNRDGLDLMREAAAIDDKNIANVLAVSSEQQRLFFLHTLRSHRNMLLSLVAERFADDSDAVRLAYECVLRRKGLVVEAQAGQQRQACSDHESYEQSQRLLKLRQRIARTALDGPGPQVSLHDHQNRLKEWERERTHLEETLSTMVPVEAECATRASVSNVLSRLPAEVLCIEYVRYAHFDFSAKYTVDGHPWIEHRYMAFVLTGENREIHLVELGSADEINELIHDFHSCLERAGSRTKSTTGLGEQRQLEAAPESATNPADSDHVSSGNALRARIVDVCLQHAVGNPETGRPPMPESVETGIDHSQGSWSWLRSELPNLLLSPDGELWRVPFDALPSSDLIPLRHRRDRVADGITRTGEDDLRSARPQHEYLVDHFLIAHISSGRDILNSADLQLDASSPPVVFADPNYDLSLSSEMPQPVRSEHDVQDSSNRDTLRGVHFRSLPGTRSEGVAVAEMLGVALIDGDHATESRLKRCESPVILHLATHGFFLADSNANEMTTTSLMDAGLSGDNQVGNGRWKNLTSTDSPLLRSGIALAGCNTWLAGGVPPIEAEDGLLTAEDVAALDLSRTRLVVLSACETGLGLIQAGEGVFGLGRSFTIAGAKTLLMSLWKVPDDATNHLMVAFYKQAISGWPAPAALRHARLLARRNSASPRDWGAFICQLSSIDELQRSIIGDGRL